MVLCGNCIVEQKACLSSQSSDGSHFQKKVYLYCQLAKYDEIFHLKHYHVGERLCNVNG